jgi:hypothetical protein
LPTWRTANAIAVAAARFGAETVYRAAHDKTSLTYAQEWLYAKTACRIPACAPDAAPFAHNMAAAV